MAPSYLEGNFLNFMWNDATGLQRDDYMLLITLLDEMFSLTGC